MQNDPVNKPKHYNNHPSGIECKEIAMYFPSSIANAIKYIWRYEDKENPIQDLEKCLWYLKETMKSIPNEFTRRQLIITREYLLLSKFRTYLVSEKNEDRYDFMFNIFQCYNLVDLGYINHCIKIVEEILKEEKGK